MAQLFQDDFSLPESDSVKMKENVPLHTWAAMRLIVISSSSHSSCMRNTVASDPVACLDDLVKHLMAVKLSMTSP